MSADASSPALGLMTFRLDATRYAIASALVDQVFPMLPVRVLPLAPKGLIGVTHVRGTSLPLLDPRPRLGLQPWWPTTTAHILAVSIGGRRVGLVVDSAEELIAVPVESICHPGSLAPKTPYGIGVTHHAGEPLLVIDIDALVNDDVWTTLDRVTPASEPGDG